MWRAFVSLFFAPHCCVQLRFSNRTYMKFFSKGLAHPWTDPLIHPSITTMMMERLKEQATEWYARILLRVTFLLRWQEH